MKTKRLKRRIKSQIELIILILVFIGAYMWFTNFHIHDGLPTEQKGTSIGSQNLLMINNTIYFQNNSRSRNLCSATLDGMRISHRHREISHIKKLANEGNILYALCDDELLYVYDVASEKVIKKIHIKWDIMPN